MNLAGESIENFESLVSLLQSFNETRDFQFYNVSPINHQGPIDLTKKTIPNSELRIIGANFGYPRRHVKTIISNIKNLIEKEFILDSTITRNKVNDLIELLTKALSCYKVSNEGINHELTNYWFETEQNELFTEWQKERIQKVFKEEIEIIKQVNEYLVERMVKMHLEDPSRMPINKIKWNLSVKDLATLFRLLSDEGLIEFNNEPIKLGKTISECFYTEKSESISPKSFKNSFNDPDQKEKNELNIRLTNMKTLLKNHVGKK